MREAAEVPLCTDEAPCASPTAYHICLGLNERARGPKVTVESPARPSRASRGFLELWGRKTGSPGDVCECLGVWAPQGPAEVRVLSIQDSKERKAWSEALGLGAKAAQGIRNWMLGRLLGTGREDLRVQHAPRGAAVGRQQGASPAGRGFRRPRSRRVPHSKVPAYSCAEPRVHRLYPRD